MKIFLIILFIYILFTPNDEYYTYQTKEVKNQITDEEIKVSNLPNLDNSQNLQVLDQQVKKINNNVENFIENNPKLVEVGNLVVSFLLNILDASKKLVIDTFKILNFILH